MKTAIQRKLWLLMPLVALILISCGKDPIITDTTIKPITFQVPDSMFMTIPPAINLNLPFDLPIIPVNTSMNQEVDNLNPLIELVEKIYLNELTLTITTPGETFDFLKNMTLYAQAPGEPELMMAYTTNIPTNIGNVLELTPVPNQLDKYLKSPDFGMRVEVTARKLFSNEIDIRSNMLMDVTLINY